MSDPTYIERLRAIRDRIGEQLQHMSWQEWEAQAREDARRDPRLAKLIEEAECQAHVDQSVARRDR